MQSRLLLDSVCLKIIYHFVQLLILLDFLGIKIFIDRLWSWIKFSNVINSVDIESLSSSLAIKIALRTVLKELAKGMGKCLKMCQGTLQEPYLSWIKYSDSLEKLNLSSLSKKYPFSFFNAASTAWSIFCAIPDYYNYGLLKIICFQAKWKPLKNILKICLNSWHS